MNVAGDARSVHAIGLALAGAIPGDASQMGFKAANLACMAGAACEMQTRSM